MRSGETPEVKLRQEGEGVAEGSRLRIVSASSEGLCAVRAHTHVAQSPFGLREAA